MRTHATSPENQFAVMRAADIPAAEVARRWLIEGLWSAPAVGVVGGQPKSAKSWLALEMAVSIATGTKCLERYAVPERGGALIYLAEDSLAAVRERLVALARYRDLSLDSLDVHAITATSMRLDLERDQLRLYNTAKALSPRILVLDPLVRLHRLDENSANEISGLLAYLRKLQRELELSIVLVHHTRKNAPARHQTGQALRGSGDIHAWSDSSLYLRRRQELIALSIEHRSAPAPQPVSLRLVTDDGVAPHLEVVDSPVSSEDGESLDERVLELLKTGSPMTRSALRDGLRVKNERLGRVLVRLEEANRLQRTPAGWKIASNTDDDTRSLFPLLESRGNGTVVTTNKDPIRTK